MRAALQAEEIEPGRWSLPRLPPSDPDAMRRLACDCRELEAVLGGVARDAEWVLADLRRHWAGQAAQQAPAPLLVLRQDVATVRRSLDVFATELERLAGALADAEERHGWSWGKIAIVSTVVAVTAASVVVTVGTAGTASPVAAAADAAVMSAAAGELTAASISAASAEAAAVEGLLTAARLARTVEALRAIVIPRLMTTAMASSEFAETPLGGALIGAGTTAAIEYVEDGRIVPHDVMWGAVLGAGESFVLAPGRSRGYVELTKDRLAIMQQPARRRELIRIARARFPQDERPFSVPARQAKTHYKHAKVFGLSRPYSKQSVGDFDKALHDFVGSPSTVRIEGTWKKAPATVYTDYDSLVTVVCEPDGTYVTSVTLSDKQAWHLWHDHAIGGH